MWEGLAGSVIGGAASLFGGMQANAANAAMAREQMAFQERMANTQYQRAVTDLQKAGLNPMLAYSQGGNAVPSGAMAQIHDAVGPAVSSAVQGYQAHQAVETAKAQAENLKADTLKKSADTAFVNQETIRSAADTALAPYRQGLMSAQAHGASQLATLHGAQTDSVNISNRYSPGRLSAEIDQIKAMTQQNLSNVSLNQVTSALRGYEIPHAQNAAEAEKSWWKQNVSPYLPDVATGASSAAAIGSALRKPANVNIHKNTDNRKIITNNRGQ